MTQIGVQPEMHQSMLREQQPPVIDAKPTQESTT
jgi:hypothetical protein